jgi:hypothetical protein
VVARDADTDGTAIVYYAPFRLVLETREGRIVSDSVIAYGGFDLTAAGWPISRRPS